MTEALQTVAIEATPITPPVDTNPNRMTFADVLKTGQEAGREQRKGLFSKIKENITALKDKAAEKWQSFKETGAKIVDTAGLATTEKGRAAVGAYASQEISIAQENARRKSREAQQWMDDKLTEAGDFARTSYDGVRETWNERTKPTIQKGLVTTGKIVAFPFVATAAAAIGAYESGTALAKAGAEAGGRAIEASKQKASELAQRATDFVQDTIDEGSTRINARRHDTVAMLGEWSARASETGTGLDDLKMEALDLPGKIKDSISEKTEKFRNWWGELRAKAETKKEARLQKALEKRELAIKERALAQEIRANRQARVENRQTSTTQ